jgi:N-acetylmuramoyl-L-alanine amidase
MPDRIPDRTPAGAPDSANDRTPNQAPNRGPDPMHRRLRLIQRVVAYLLLGAATILFLASQRGQLKARLHDAAGGPAPSARDVEGAPAAGRDGGAATGLAAPTGDAAEASTRVPAPAQDGAPAASTPIEAAGLDSPIHGAFPTFTPVPTSALAAATPLPPLPTHRVGILAGHWQYDTGATCPDGRREVDVTLDVAQRVKAILNTRGLDVDILPEHEPDVPAPPLQGYRAAAMVSIHADVCNLPGYSGYKVARWRYSNLPAVDDRLVGCLNDRYAAWTGLGRHEDTISINMWNYYAFREIGLDTPAAIIELGFMGDDKAVLAGKRYEMAMGVADGVSCFLKGADK